MRALRWYGRVGILLAMAVACVARAAEVPAFSYSPYADVLSKYVDKEGMVNYRVLKANRTELDSFARALADLDPAVYAKWTDKEKIAFWINAYNALTLQVIVDHLPIKPSLIGSVIYPKNSIRQISGVWDKITFPVMGKPMTLEDIEHGTLRKQFAEPRIHFALVCAAMGCPRLRGEPYTGAKLDEQFDDQSRGFFAQRSKFRVTRERNQVQVSSIFKWFGEDFVAKYGTSMKYSGHDAAERAVLNYMSKYISEQDQQYLEQGDYQVKYLDYDWSLNEQTTKPKP